MKSLPSEENGISVIVPSFQSNLEQLCRCLKSISNQIADNLNIECYVIFDGEPFKNIQHILDIYPNFHFITIKHSGVSIARNEGIQHSHCRYLTFVDVDDVIDINERLLAHLFKDVLDIDLQLPIQRMTWKEAMNRFGSDKPDLRFGMELVDVSETVKDTEFVVFKGALENGGSVVSMQKDRAQCRERKSTSSLSLRKVTVQKVLHTLQSMRMEAGNLPSPNL